MSAATDKSTLTDVEREVIAFFVGAVQALGLPKSLGEIYGLLYISTEPLSMDDIMTRLRISLGSASQGLKQLRSFNAVRTAYKPGQRRDYYEAETEMRKLLGNFLREQMRPHLEAGKERLAHLEELVSTSTDIAPPLRQRIQKLQNWNQSADRLLPLLKHFVRP